MPAQMQGLEESYMDCNTEEHPKVFVMRTNQVTPGFGKSFATLYNI